jgi:tetratricopeptide (TPR) repeat protein
MQNKELSEDQIYFTLKLTDNLSYLNLAYLYEKGIFTEGINYKKAVALYEQAAVLGNSDACNNLGCLYESGLHPDGRNYKKAIELYEKAIELGNSDSYNNLACIYYYGYHPDGRNYEKAEELYKKSSEMGNIIACKNLISMYKNNKYSGDQAFTKIADLEEKIEELKEIQQPSPKMMKIYGSLEDECSICYKSLQKTKYQIIITVCGHMYHDECLKEYTKISSKKCSICNN